MAARAPATALVVDMTPSDIAAAAACLTIAGCRVSAVDSYQQARTALGAETPAILITDLTLGEFNGIDLVLRAKTARPDVRVVVLSRIHDPVLRREAEQLGATFVPRPVSPDELSAAICRTLFEHRDAGGEPLRPPFERRYMQRRTAASNAVASERRRVERRKHHPVFAESNPLA